MDDPKQSINTYVAAALAVLLTCGYVAAVLLQIPTPELFVTLTYSTIAAAIGISASQWQARR